jgi:hypothetical protein
MVVAINQVFEHFKEVTGTDVISPAIVSEFCLRCD